MSYDYHGKVVIITGGGRGLGAQITRAFAKSGASIVITGRTEAPLQELCQKMQAEFQADISARVADGSDEAQVKAVVAEVIDRYGKIDLLINNAKRRCTACHWRSRPRRPLIWLSRPASTRPFTI